MLTDPVAGPLVIGHRGSSGRFPENTLLAFQRAIDAGADALEFDVRISADQIPVVIHDGSLDRMAGRTGLVADLSARELTAVDVGLGERIPTLVDVLESFPTVPVLIDIKEARASEPAVRVVKAAGAGTRVLGGSFIHRALMPFRRAGIETAGSRVEAGLFWSTARVGFPPFRVKYRAFSLPEWSGRAHVVDERFLRVARRCSIPVHVWSVDDPSEAVRLWGIGVTGIITNCPEELCRVRAQIT